MLFCTPLEPTVRQRSLKWHVSTSLIMRMRTRGLAPETLYDWNALFFADTLHVPVPQLASSAGFLLQILSGIGIKEILEGLRTWYGGTWHTEVIADGLRAESHSKSQNAKMNNEKWEMRKWGNGKKVHYISLGALLLQSSNVMSKSSPSMHSLIEVQVNYIWNRRECSDESFQHEKRGTTTAASVSVLKCSLLFCTTWIRV